MCGSCFRDTDNNSSDYIKWHTLQYRGSQNKTKWIIGFQNIIGFFIITLWVLRWQRWWWWWRHHVRRLIRTWLFWGPVGHHNLGNVCYRKWRDRKWRDRKSRDRKSRHRKSRHFPPLFFLTIVVVQNVPLFFVILFTASGYSFWYLLVNVLFYHSIYGF